MKDLITIIAEKPSVATEIGRIVGADEQHRDGVNGYVEGNGYAVTWAFGHLVTLKSPEEMGFTYGQVPMLPDRWETKVIAKKGKDGKSAVDPVIKKQLDIIKRLFSRSKEVIIATDAGREGELIFRYIYEYLGIEVPSLKRLWISALTREDIKEGLENLRDASQYAGLNAAAHLRSQSDWLIGYNASKALRLATLSTTFLSLGRVQTPTLGLICERYKENKNFIPTPFWKVEVQTSKDGFELKAVSERDYATQDAAEQALETTRNNGVLRVTEVTKKDVVSKPPLLFDLTSLQRAANTRHGLTAAETLKVAQSLYEKKLITYPRTGSSYIPETVFKNIPSLMQKTGADPAFAKAADACENARLSRRSVDDTKITDHHALLPTGELPENISSWERIIWEMITERMYQAFGRDSVSEATTVRLDGGGVPYLLRGSVIKTPGWKGIGRADDVEEKKNDDEDEQTQAALPHLEEGDHLDIEEIAAVKKTDKPKPIHTDSSLLKEMQTCGKNIEDEQAREAMKDVGLGTPATRDETIERLIRRGYVIREKRKLLPTNLGQNIWEMVKGRIVANVETTGEWERDLALVEQGKLDPEQFDARIREHTRAIVEDLKENCKAIGSAQGGIAAETFECPFCGHEMTQGRYSIRCEEDGGGCGYKVYKEAWGKKLPESAIRALCAGKMTGLIKGFTSKSGKKFDAALAPDEESKGIRPVFPEREEKPNTPSIELACPCCGKTMQEGRWAYECECGFSIKKAYGGITLSAEQLMRLADGGGVLLKGMTNSKGKKYDAKLRADEDRKEIKFDFHVKSTSPL